MLLHTSGSHPTKQPGEWGMRKNPTIRRFIQLCDSAFSPNSKAHALHWEYALLHGITQSISGLKKARPEYLFPCNSVFQLFNTSFLTSTSQKSFHSLVVTSCSTENGLRSFRRYYAHAICKGKYHNFSCRTWMGIRCASCFCKAEGRKQDFSL